MERKLPLKVKIGYGAGALSYGIPVQLVTGLFVFYSTAVLRLPGASVGLILSISIVWDAFTDPVMGYISDKTSAGVLFGRRLFYVFTGALGLAVCNYLLWSVDPRAPYGVRIFELAALLMLLKTFSTVLTTPYLALGSELTSDYTERTSVQSFRTAFFFLGYMFPALAGMALYFRPSPSYPNGQLNPGAYPPLGLTASALTIAFAAVCVFFTYKKSAAPETARKRGFSFSGLFRETVEALKCPDYRNIALALLFINMAMGIVGAAGMHVFTYTFGFSSYKIAVVFGSLFVAALAAQPVWAAAAKKYEKRTALKACLIIDVAVSAVFAALVLTSGWVSENYLCVVPAAVAMGFSLGGSIALPYSMIADTVDKDEYFSGVRKEGVFYGSATFMYKASQAVSASAAGLYIDLVGFDPAVSQSQELYQRLGLILPAGFLVCFAAALFFTSKYTLDRAAVAYYQRGTRERGNGG